MKSILEQMIKEVIVKTDKISINEIKGDGDYILYEIDVDKEDRGRLIGRNGKTYKLIYEFMKIVASKNKKKIHLQIIE